MLQETSGCGADSGVPWWFTASSLQWMHQLFPCQPSLWRDTLLSAIPWRRRCSLYLAIKILHHPQYYIYNHAHTLKCFQAVECWYQVCWPWSLELHFLIDYLVIYLCLKPIKPPSRDMLSHKWDWVGVKPIPGIILPLTATVKYS